MSSKGLAFELQEKHKVETSVGQTEEQTSPDALRRSDRFHSSEGGLMEESGVAQSTNN